MHAKHAGYNTTAIIVGSVCQASRVTNSTVSATDMLARGKPAYLPTADYYKKGQ